jgi:hypothetical protein
MGLKALGAQALGVGFAQQPIPQSLQTPWALRETLQIDPCAKSMKLLNDGRININLSSLDVIIWVLRAFLKVGFGGGNQKTVWLMNSALSLSV